MGFRMRIREQSGARYYGELTGEALHYISGKPTIHPGLTNLRVDIVDFGVGYVD